MPLGTQVVPDDPALPALGAIRAQGLARAMPALRLNDGPVELVLRGYKPGSRATLEARAGHRHLAIKVYAKDPAPEAELYRALGAAGSAVDSGIRVPPLLAWDRALKMLVVGWLEGPTAEQLIENEQGRRAGELCARWLQRCASLPITLGAPLGPGSALRKADKWVARLQSADPALGTAAAALTGELVRTPPRESAPRLVHGTLYARHVLDLGDGPGVIDWQRFGQGPMELDAGIFLATTWRMGLRDERLGDEAARAEKALLEGIKDLVCRSGVAWYRAAMLLRLANKLARRTGDRQERARLLLREVGRFVEVPG